MQPGENLPVSYPRDGEFGPKLKKGFPFYDLSIIEEVIKGPTEEAGQRRERLSGTGIRHPNVSFEGGTFESINTLHISGKTDDATGIRSESRDVSLSRELLEILAMVAETKEKSLLCLIIAPDGKKYYKKVEVAIEALPPDPSPEKKKGPGIRGEVHSERRNVRRQIKFTISTYEWKNLWKTMWSDSDSRKGKEIGREILRLDPYGPKFEESKDPRQKRRRELPPGARAQRTDGGSPRYNVRQTSEIYTKLQEFRKNYLMLARAHGYPLEGSDEFFDSKLFQ